MMWRAIVGALMIVGSVPVSAAALTVRVVDAKGHPVSNAVVTFRTSGPTARPRQSGSYSVSQKGMQFHPFVSVVPVGAKVSFPNLDPTRHHVYSFSSAKPFELKLFAKDQSRSIVFDKPGVVALGCNIHDAMTAFIYVTDSAWTARTDGNGTARFADAPGSGGRLSVWHPYLRAKANVVERQLAASDRNANFTVALRAPPMAMNDGY